MLLTLDIGNTNVKAALFDGSKVCHYWRLSTNIRATSDEYGIQLMNMFASRGYKAEDVKGIIVSSVVPSINFTIDHMVRNYFGKSPLLVTDKLDMGIDFSRVQHSELGTDIMADSVAAVEEYGSPCITVDFGTATTFGVVDENRVFLGGCIFPGVKLSSEALVTGTAKLPRFEIARPDRAIGTSTLGFLQSGLFFGYVGLVRNVIRKLKQELGKEAVVAATGGIASVLSDECGVIDHLDGLLTLKGLRLIYELNKAGGT